MVKGEVTKVEYFRNYDQPTNTYSDLIVQEDITNFRQNGFVAYREMLITWYLEDDTPSPSTKLRTKYYSGEEAIAEGKRRRGNIINEIEINVVGMIAVAEGISIEDAAAIGEAFLNSLNTEVTGYVRSGNTALITAVENATDSWLTIQQQVRIAA